MALPSVRTMVVMPLWGVCAWFVAGWCCGPVDSVLLTLEAGEACQVLGFAEDGGLVGVERTPHTSRWAVWKRSLPDGGREDVWEASGVRTEPPDDIMFRLQKGGRWLFVSKMGPQMRDDSDPIIDLRTGRVYEGRDEGMRWVTPEGGRLVTDDGLPGLRVNDLETGAIVGRIDDDWVDAISPDGRWLLAESSGTLRVWRLDPTPSRTMIVCSAPRPATAHLGTANDADHQSTCRFSDDSRRVVVYGEQRVEAYDLERGVLLSQRNDASPIAVSGDGRLGYERNGHVFRLETGETLVEPTGWRNDISGVAVEPDGWFLSQRNPQGTWWGRGWPGMQVRLGPYTISISADQSLPATGCDLVHPETAERIVLPQWYFPSAMSVGGERDEWSLSTHRQRLAMHNGSSGVVRVIEMPPSGTTGGRGLAAAGLFLAPLLWRALFRRRRRGRSKIPELGRESAG